MAFDEAAKYYARRLVQGVVISEYRSNRRENTKKKKGSQLSTRRSPPTVKKVGG
jgi:hypothetical protein